MKLRPLGFMGFVFSAASCLPIPAYANDLLSPRDIVGMKAQQFQHTTLSCEIVSVTIDGRLQISGYKLRCHDTWPPPGMHTGY